MTQIWERLFLGSFIDAEELAEGNPHRITTVVSLSEIPVERKRRDINYLHLPIEDAEPVPARQFGRILNAIEREHSLWHRARPLQSGHEPCSKRGCGVHGCCRLHGHRRSHQGDSKSSAIHSSINHFS